MTWVIGQKAGPLTIERIEGVRRLFTPADTSEEPRAVLHTTEGGWTSSLGVFARTGTPTFMVGFDATAGRHRCGQMLPIGEMALTLQNDSGGVETNRWARAQIEVVEFTKTVPWLPDEVTTAALAGLMKIIRDVAHVPLIRGGDGTRSVERWRSRAGWFGHIEVPENDHTDPGAIKWATLFALAGGEEEDVDLGGWTLEEAQAFATWHLVERREIPRPSTFPAGTVPDEVWAFAKWSHRFAIEYGPDVSFLDWLRWIIIDQRKTPRPENVSEEIPRRWWTGFTIEQGIANDYAAKLVDVAKSATAEQIAAADLRIRELQAALESEQADDGEREARIRELVAQILTELGGTP